MRARDPLTIASLLFVVWAAVVALVAADRLLAAPDKLADEFRATEARTVPQPSRDGIEITIEPGLSAEGIADLLVRRGVLGDAGAFETLLTYSGAGPLLQAGQYELPANLPATEVIRRLREGLTSDVLLAVPEGLRVEEVGELVAAASITTVEEWEAALESVRDHPVLEGLPEGASLNGYLLPASFPFGDDANAEDVVRAMLDAFAEQVDADLIAEAEASGLTLHEVLTLAAIVEREAVVDEERELIAGVFLNRLEQGIAFGADPTVQFAVATEESVDEFGWWKQELTVDDLALDSPYNTYLYAGMPPGPIANPGLDAIEAVIRPAETDAIYFVAAPECDGSHLFATTDAEHNVNVEAFRNSPCGQ
ncbi:MAG: endolytic transglycosylase MltG [Dehalococcoidia bacterium]|nr:endolytic transglycosylase MltG [Dehalococcoidia bacterium]